MTMRGMHNVKRAVRAGSRVVMAGVLVPMAVVAGTLNPQAALQEGGEQADMRELWIAPRPGERNLLFGPGGAELAPDPKARYEVIAIKIGGFSDGYDVRDPEGREWSVKFPPEASPEVVASRLIWGLGYHQPPVYFLPAWQADGASAPNPQLPARFREDDPDFYGLDRVDMWAFDDNPFVGTRQLQGLLVLQSMLGNSDLKPSNNSLYELDSPVEGASRWYVVRDVGHTFGRSGRFESPRGDIDAFESTGFIRRVVGERVELERAGRHSELYTNISIADVRWICEGLDALTDKQWADAFRAGGYESGIAGRFIREMKSKIAEGLTLPESTEPRRQSRFSWTAAADAAQAKPSAVPLRGPDAETVADFEKRVNDVVALRDKLAAQAPRLSDTATPAEIDKTQRALESLLRESRKTAKHGDVLTPPMQEYVRRVITELLATPAGKLIRASIMDENPVALKIAVNDRYPDEVPLSTMPPQLLERLPPMPEELEYRFLGDTLVILDPHAHVIIDFVPRALPE